jgi:hypothetical protein
VSAASMFEQDGKIAQKRGIRICAGSRLDSAQGDARCRGVILKGILEVVGGNLKGLGGFVRCLDCRARHRNGQRLEQFRRLVLYIVPLRLPALPLIARLNWLRHTTATLLKTLGGPARDAMGILGHSRIAVTLEVYTDADDPSRKEAIDRISSLLDGGGG